MTRSSTTDRPLRRTPRRVRPTLSMPHAMDAAFSGSDCRLVLRDGREVPVAVADWSGRASAADRELFVDPCRGSALDVGCGPGRIAEALAGRPAPTLGIDVSEVAVQQTRARGAAATRCDVYDALPRTGRWRHVLLADGNIGIGGRPGRLLHRVAQLLHPEGTALVELHGSSGMRVHDGVRLQVGHEATRAFSWATVGTGAIDGLAATARLEVSDVRRVEDRCVATLRHVR